MITNMYLFFFSLTSVVVESLTFLRYFTELKLKNIYWAKCYKN